MPEIEPLVDCVIRRTPGEAFPYMFQRPVILPGVADCERATPGDNIVIPPSIMPAAKPARVLRFASINFNSCIFFSVGLVLDNEPTNLFGDSVPVLVTTESS